MMSVTVFGRPIADRLAVGLSTLCLIHCLFLSLILTVYSSSLLIMVSGEIFHLTIFLITVPISVLAFFVGYQGHKNFWVAAIGLVGLVLLIASATVVHDLGGAVVEKMATIVGS